MTAGPKPVNGVQNANSLHTPGVQVQVATLPLRLTVEARKLEYDCPPSPKLREEGKPA